MKSVFTLITLIAASVCFGQTPELTSWIINQSSTTGYNGILSNVLSVSYNNQYIYVSANSIPSYSIGPWQSNPNTPSAQNFVYRITRSPQQALTQTATGLGHIGVWKNGVSIFNAKDAMSYNNQGVWNQNAIVVEGISFDDCLGHPAPNGEYHTHLNPACLYDYTNTAEHAPLLGYAFDGFPIYGAYAYSNTDGTGTIVRMRSSYQLRNITTRTTLADGTVLSANQYGPAISVQYPLGYYLEDYEYVQGSGDLDEHNGRFCVTPEYPNGTYCYFATLNEEFEATFPYTLGPKYYGIVTTGNTGLQGGHNTIPGDAVLFTPTSVETLQSIETTQLLQTTSGWRFSDNAIHEYRIYDVSGKLILNSRGNEIAADMMTPGIYLITVVTEAGNHATFRVFRS